MGLWRHRSRPRGISLVADLRLTAGEARYGRIGIDQDHGDKDCRVIRSARFVQPEGGHLVARPPADWLISLIALARKRGVHLFGCEIGGRRLRHNDTGRQYDDDANQSGGELPDALSQA
jgi:hypothetical protein